MEKFFLQEKDYCKSSFIYILIKEKMKKKIEALQSTTA